MKDVIAPYSWAEFQRPLVCLAPMDGVTNSAYRQIVRKINKDVLLFSEFTNVDGILRSAHVRKRLDYDPSEHPFFIQLFGESPQSFAEASKIVAARGIMGIDINMGCPSKKIVSSQHGSALMKDVDRACRIVEAIRASCNLEVSVKTRLGWDSLAGLIDFGKSLESAGTSLITIHGRTYKQAFRGNANWEPIYALKEVLNIPVLGNGDVENYEQGLQKIKNLDGFMIGRHAIGNPWCFLDTSQTPIPPLPERLEVAMEHYHLLRSSKPEAVAIREFRKYLGEYVRGFRHAKAWRAELMKTESDADFLQLMQALQKENPELIE